ncbi:MAG: DUF4390 domain-containing protein [Sutterellaceae bacterium]|nr:DUF4390 domain-containing protein [Burkholderiaceae bacterium]MCX7900851.1 DUF4390 domain-containing protein [Burkholderiaceae bacterium]MDW8429280.1 DUF4390 domain-containing protein [Sutterellaceae bacterium]
MAPCSARAAARDRWRHAMALLATLCCLWAVPVAALASERIVVRAAELSLGSDGEGALVLDAAFDFELPAVLEDALKRGIALYFIVEFELYRTRWWWFDKKLVSAARTFRLSYSPLTRQYRLASGALAQPFDTLADALAVLRRLRAWRVADRSLIRPDDDYKAQVRMRLDTSQLPRPFQINVLTSREWTLASDWRHVQVSAELAR